MRFRTLPVLSASDQDLLTDMEVGLGSDQATVLTYLVSRSESESVSRTPATRLEIQVGTGLSRDAAVSATSALEQSGLVKTSTVTSEKSGRDRKAWRPVGPREDMFDRVRRHQADRLLTRAEELDELHPRTNGAEPPGTAQSDPDRVSVGLNWTKSPVHVALLLGQESGHYRQAGISVDLMDGHGSGQAVDSLRDGDSDICIAGPASLMNRRREDDSLLPIALLYQRSMVVVYTLADRFDDPFERIEQLRDRRIAMVPNSETGLVTRLLLAQADILDDVTIVETAGDEREALRGGSAEAAAGIISDPLSLREAGEAVDSILLGRNFPIPGLAVVTRPHLLSTRRSDLSALLAGTMAGWSEARKSPAVAATTLEAIGVTGPEGTVEALIEEFGTNEVVREEGWGWQTEQQWSRMRIAMEDADIGGTSR